MTDYSKEYPYLYETHLHTCQASACAGCTGADMAAACKAAGYTGIIVTDHNWGGNTAVDRNLPWKDWVHGFFEGYRDAKREGDRIGLQVFCGWESGFHATEFLIYGLDEAWMIKHPELHDADVKEQYQMIKENGGMVIHAHPFREEDYIPEIRLFPEYVDGVEGINATHSSHKSYHHNKREFDTKAIAYAGEHKLPMTAGSDIHTTSLLGGGMAFKKPLKDIGDYIEAVKGNGDYLMTNGDEWFDRNGQLLK